MRKKLLKALMVCGLLCWIPHANVQASDVSTYEVTIPKSINLDQNGDGTYNVKISKLGIKDYETISVTPSTSFQMTTTGKQSKTASVSQSKTLWKYSETGNNLVSTGSIHASGITAGTWTGNLNFNVKLNEIPKYSIKYTMNGGTMSGQRTYYTTNTLTFTLPTPTKTGYTFVGWSGSNGTTPSKNVSVNVGSSGDKEYVANWTPNTDTPYVVRHYQMNMDGKTHSLKETDNLKGTTDSTVTPVVKTYAGFTAPTTESVVINPAGSTVLNYYYSRNKYYLDMNGNLDGKVMSTIANYGTADVYVQGTKVATGVTDYCYQSYFGSTYEINNIQVKPGRKYEGVDIGALKGTIGAAQVTVSLKFTTIPYTITYDLDGGGIVGPTNRTGYNVDTVSFTLTNPVKPNYIFTGWTGSNGTTPSTNVTIAKGSTGNKTFKANWKLKAANTLALSATSGTMTYPTTTSTFKVATNVSGGNLAVTSSDNSVATATISDSTVTVTWKKAGTAVITVLSAETDTYLAATAKYTVTCKNGNISATAKNGTAVYNGSPTTGGASVTVTAPSSGSTIKYGTSSTTCTSVAIPAYTAAGEYTVYYQVSAANYTTLPGSFTIKISKAMPVVTAPTSKSLTYNGSAQALINAGSTTAGTLQYKVGSTGTYSTSIPTATNAGTYTVYYKVIGDSNHNDVAEKSINVTIAKKAGSVTLSETSGSVTYPTTTKTFTITGNTSGGTLSVASSDSTIATASLSGATVTVTWKKAGTANITVTSAETGNYNAASAVYKATIVNGTSTVTTKNGTGTYNGSAQTGGASVTVSAPTSGTTIKYGTTSGSYTSTTMPTRTDAGTTTVYYQVTANNYNTVTGSLTITLGKAAGSLTLNPLSKTLSYTGSAQALVTAGVTNTGTLQYKLGASGTYSSTVPTATSVGTYTIYYKVVGDKNHNDTTETSITSVINKAAGSVVLSASSKTDTYPASKSTTFTVNTNKSGGALNVTSSNTDVATVAISGTTVTVTYKTVGSATITVSSAATGSYNAASATYALTINWSSYTVTYNYNYNGGSSATKTTATVVYGNAVDLTPTAVKGGWTFIGWNTDSTATTKLTSYTMPLGNVTLYAIYSKTMTATFKDYSSSFQTRTKYVTIYNKATTGTVTAYNGNTISGWSWRGWSAGNTTAGNATATYANGATITMSDSATYYGLYSQSLTLTYNGNGGSSPTAATGTRYFSGSNNYVNPSVTLPSSGRDFYTFNGWSTSNTASSGSTGSYSYDTSRTLYATWSYNSDVTISASNRYGLPTAGVLVVPSYVLVNGGKHHVVGIEANAFKGCTGLTSVTIQSGIRYIGDEAFAGSDSSYMNILSVSIPGTCTSIGTGAFWYSRLTGSLVLPEGLQSMGIGSFACTKITSVTLPNSLTTMSGSNFYSCTSLRTVNWGSGITSLGGYNYFKGCTSLSTTIPSCVRSIGHNEAFYNVAHVYYYGSAGGAPWGARAYN